MAGLSLEGPLEKSRESDKHVLFVADAAAAGLKSEKVVLLNAPEDMELMFCGPISTEPSPSCKPVVEFENGLTFFIHPTASPPAGDIIVPAWLAKSTPKADLATLELGSISIPAFVTESGEVSLDHPHVTHIEANETLKKVDAKRVAAVETLRKTISKSKSVQTRLRKVRGKLRKARGNSHLKAGTPAVGHVAAAAPAPADGITSAETAETVPDKAEESHENAGDEQPHVPHDNEGAGGGSNASREDEDDEDCSFGSKSDQESFDEGGLIPMLAAPVPLPPSLQQWRRKESGQLMFGPSRVPEVVEIQLKLHLLLGMRPQNKLVCVATFSSPCLLSLWVCPSRFCLLLCLCVCVFLTFSV